MKLDFRKIEMRHLWLALPVVFLLWKSFVFTLPPLDFWWHLKMGEVIAATRSIPDVDLFSFTAASQPFVVQNWLAELIYYGTYRLGGFPLLVFLHALLSLAAFLPVYQLCLEKSANMRLAVVIAFLAALSAIGNIRPHLFSFVLFAIFYWILEGYRNRLRNHLWLLPLLMLLWVNLHGAFVLGLLLIAIAAGSQAVRRWMDKSSEALTGVENRNLLLVLGACVLATLVNPEGYRVYEYVQTVAADRASQLFVTEWQPPRVDDLGGILVFFGPFFLTIFALAVSRTRPDVTELAVLFAFAVLGLKSLRNGAWFGIIAFPICARFLSRFETRYLEPLGRFRIAKQVGELFSPESVRSVGNPRLNLVIAIVGIALLVAQSPWVRPYTYGIPLLDKRTPVAAMDYMAEAGLSGNVFHPQVFGDYLIWRLWPGQRSFIDGRVHLFGEKFVRDYQALFTDTGWEAKLARWDVRYLLLESDPANPDSAQLLKNVKASHRWKKLFEDDIAVLFELVP